jgi:hypothetical protein
MESPSQMTFTSLKKSNEKLSSGKPHAPYNSGKLSIKSPKTFQMQATENSNFSVKVPTDKFGKGSGSPR